MTTTIATTEPAACGNCGAPRLACWEACWADNVPVGFDGDGIHPNWLPERLHERDYILERDVPESARGRVQRSVL